ncbi:ankyrin repeat-containing domain protein, partial [Baffinella frigidus]
VPGAPGIDDLSRATGRTPLMDAAISCHAAVMSTLISSGNASLSTRDRSEQTAVHHAVSSGCVEGTRLLLLHGADPDAQDRFGYTPLILAVRRSAHLQSGGHVAASAELMAVLLDADAEVHTADKDNRTALLWAAWAGRLHSLTPLLARCAELEELRGGALGADASLGRNA